jgi:8-oxo-dGTP pyrophosphatase MutT (NUDIX family)
MTVLERDAIRAILLTPAREVLLMRIRAPGAERVFWITPGGGMQPGETHEACLRRELQEEVGLEDFTVGPRLWRRQHTFNWLDRRILQREQYHVVLVERFEPRMSDPVEAKTVEGFKWWSEAELREARESVTPHSLGEIVARYLNHGPPAEPLAVEVLVD